MTITQKKEVKALNLLTGNIKPIYFKYLSAAFGSAMITSVYSLVDMAMVGQYQGPDGTAALAVVAPIWNIIYSLGLLMGIGGSVIFSTVRGQENKKNRNENEYFLHLLFPGVDEAKSRFLCICFQRLYCQWVFDYAAANCGRG